MYVYIKSNQHPGLYTAGFYRPVHGGTSEFVPESNHDHAGDAAARVHYLNGGTERAIGDLANEVEGVSTAMRRRG